MKVVMGAERNDGAVLILDGRYSAFARGRDQLDVAAAVGIFEKDDARTQPIEQEAARQVARVGAADASAQRALEHEIVGRTEHGPDPTLKQRHERSNVCFLFRTAAPDLRPDG